jgi:hypothetical protein
VNVWNVIQYNFSMLRLFEVICLCSSILYKELKPQCMNRVS